MESPVLGSVVRASSLGIKSTNAAIWAACEDCGAERWVIMRAGEPSARRCKTCAGRRVGRGLVPVPSLCEFCADPYSKARGTQRFCSAACQQASWRKEHPEDVRRWGREWARRNQEQGSVYRKAYSRANKDRVNDRTRLRRARRRGNGGTMTVAQWRGLCAKYGGRCLACGEITKLTIDHVIPVVLGGSSDMSNIQPLCFPCNIRKGVSVIDYRKAA